MTSAHTFIIQVWVWNSWKTLLPPFHLGTLFGSSVRKPVGLSLCLSVFERVWIEYCRVRKWSFRSLFQATLNCFCWLGLMYIMWLNITFYSRIFMNIKYLGHFFGDNIHTQCVTEDQMYCAPVSCPMDGAESRFWWKSVDCFFMQLMLFITCAFCSPGELITQMA